MVPTVFPLLNSFRNSTRKPPKWKRDSSSLSSYTFILKTPPAAVLIRKAVGIEKGSGNPLLKKVGTLSQKSLEEIAKQKLPDLNANDLEAAKKIIAGTARSMGVEVEAK